MGQTSIFDYLYQEYKITKPIRLIEMFAGYGSQHLALKYLGLQVESHKIIEWAVPSIQAYKDLHFTNKNNDYTVNMTSDELINKLLNYGISANYNEPMTYEQIKRKGYEWQKQVYNNIKNTNNLVNIMNVKGQDLEISELDKYEYILTYSFPCQDLSLGGKRLGMDEDSETRSSMLWQVKRILDELKQLNKLPNVLLMENVPQVIAKDNLQNMEKWDFFLSRLGYKSYIKNLIATDYGIPQIRNRTFMISILGDYSYTFPKPMPLELKLSDMLEKEVDEKYFLSQKMLSCFMEETKSGYPRKEQFLSALKNPNEKDIANTITTKAGSRPSDNFIIEKEKIKKYKNHISWEDEKGRINTQDHRAYDGELIGTIPAMERGVPKILIPEATKQGYAVAELGDGVYINRPHQKRGVVQKGKIQTIKTSCDDVGVVVKDTRNLKEKLCDDLIESGAVKGGEVINHSYTVSRNTDRTPIETTDGIMPTLTTRPDTPGVVVGVKGIATNVSEEWAKKPIDEHSRTLLANKSNCGVGVMFNNLRIRKITPLEAFRLMGVKDDDFDKIKDNQSNSSLYHLAGDSIVVNVLMAIFKQML